MHSQEKLKKTKKTEPINQPTKQKNNQKKPRACLIHGIKSRSYRSQHVPLGSQFWVYKHIKYLGRWILKPWGSFEATCNSNKVSAAVFLKSNPVLFWHFQQRFFSWVVSGWVLGMDILVLPFGFLWRLSYQKWGTNNESIHGAVHWKPGFIHCHTHKSTFCYFTHGSNIGGGVTLFLTILSNIL